MSRRLVRPALLPRAVVTSSCVSSSFASSVLRREFATTEQAASAAAPKKEAFKDLEFVVPSDWDLTYLAKYDIPSPTAEQLAALVEAPLEMQGRAGQIACDLFEFASVYGELDTISDQLNELRKMAAANPLFAEHITQKSNSKKENREIFESVFKKASPPLKKFLARMVENSDFHRLLLVAEHYNTLVREHKKELNVTLSLPELPTPEKLEKLKARVAFSHLPKGSKPIWEVVEKPFLLSGYTLVTKDYTIDRSGAKKRKELEDRLTQIYAKIRASTPTFQSSEPVTPFVFKEANQMQTLATALNESRRDEIEEQKKHYKTNFVDWV